MISQRIVRDEREAGIDLAADRLSYLFLAYGLLVAVAYRAIALGQGSWDLLGLVVLSGVIGFIYRMRARVATRGWAGLTLASVLVAAVVAAAVVVVVGAR